MRVRLPHVLRTKTAVYAGLALLIFSVCQQSIAMALDVPFFSSNDILYYNPDDCAVSSSTSGTTTVAVVGNDNAEKVFNFLTTTSFAGLGGKPFNAVQAAGALGNFQQESSMNPAAVEPNGNGHGLAQWSFDRWATLQSLASSQGKDWTDLGLQLTMINNELNGGEGTRLATLDNGEFLSVTDPARASYLFQVSYERAGQPAQANRDSAATAYYAQFKDKAPAAAPASTTSSSGSSCANSQGSGNYGNANFTFYSQCDQPWGPTVTVVGTVCDNACGPTSVAMAIKNMTGQNVTPTDTTDFATKSNLWDTQITPPSHTPDGGTTFQANVQIAANWKLNASIVSQSDSQNIDYIKGILDNGGMVMVAGKGARPYYGNVAHFVLIRAITPDGHLLIANPAPTGPDDNTRQWDAGDIINSNTFGGVAFTK